jgi:uncharacterized membrane protein (DUF2068 family)
MQWYPPAKGAARIFPGKMQSPALQNETDRAAHHHHNRWLVVIGVLKLLKAVVFVLVGIGAVRLLHKDVVDLFSRLLAELNFDPESRFVNTVLDKVALLNDHRLRMISTAIFSYATLDVVEGVGLLLEKAWAEYLTIIVTASFLPWEMFEVVRHITWIKLILLIVNIAVVVYLIYDVRKSLHSREVIEELAERSHSQSQSFLPPHARSDK